MTEPHAQLRKLEELEREPWAVISRATDYAESHFIEPHVHARHQLIHAIEGVMVVHSQGSQWTMPPSRGLWMPAGVEHAVRCVGALKMRSLYVQPESAPDMPEECKAIAITPLLKELIKASVDIAGPYPDDSRAGRIMGLILDEIRVLPTLPLNLPQPTDPRLQRLCRELQECPDDTATLADWAARLGIDAKTIQRLFHRETGMTFGHWRQQARLLLALERIASGERIIDLAGALGYDSPSAFASMFKRQFGRTPSRFFR